MATGILGEIASIDYVEADYDPCREWLRLITAVTAILLGLAAVYPIHLGVDCYLDSADEVVDLKQCKNIFNIEFSMSLMVGACVVELVMVMLFFYACRHEFCCVKRKYKRPLIVPCRGCADGPGDQVRVTPIQAP